MKFCLISGVVGANHGQGRVNLEIVSEAVRRGHEVLVIAERVDAIAVAAGARTVVLPAPSWTPGRLLRDQMFALRSRRALRAEKGGFDAILTNGFATWPACDVNAVHFVHASWVRSSHHAWRVRRNLRSLYAFLYSRLNVTLERIAFRRAGLLVAVSESVATDLRRHVRPTSRIQVVPNGVDTDEFHPGYVDRAEMGLPIAVPLGLFSGDLTSTRKNLDTVLRVTASVPGLHLAVAGGGDRRPHCDLADQLGIADRVHFLGFRKDMPALLRASDVLIFPSRYEACSLVLLEALASGVPVITARSAGGSELITPDVGAVVDDCNDVGPLVAALERILGDDEERNAMGARGRALAETLNWGVMAGRYVDLLVEAGRARGDRRRG